MQGSEAVVARSENEAVVDGDAGSHRRRSRSKSRTRRHHSGHHRHHHHRHHGKGLTENQDPDEGEEPLDGGTPGNGRPEEVPGTVWKFGARWPSTLNIPTFDPPLRTNIEAEKPLFMDGRENLMALVSYSGLRIYDTTSSVFTLKVDRRADSNCKGAYLCALDPTSKSSLVAIARVPPVVESQLRPPSTVLVLNTGFTSVVCPPGANELPRVSCLQWFTLSTRAKLLFIGCVDGSVRCMDVARGVLGEVQRTPLDYRTENDLSSTDDSRERQLAVTQIVCFEDENPAAGEPKTFTLYLSSYVAVTLHQVELSAAAVGCWTPLRTIPLIVRESRSKPLSQLSAWETVPYTVAKLGHTLLVAQPGLQFQLVNGATGAVHPKPVKLALDPNQGLPKEIFTKIISIPSSSGNRLSLVALTRGATLVFVTTEGPADEGSAGKSVQPDLDPTEGPSTSSLPDRLKLNCNVFTESRFPQLQSLHPIISISLVRHLSGLNVALLTSKGICLAPLHLDPTHHVPRMTSSGLGEKSHPRAQNVSGGSHHGHSHEGGLRTSLGFGLLTSFLPRGESSSLSSTEGNREGTAPSSSGSFMRSLLQTASATGRDLQSKVSTLLPESFPLPKASTTTHTSHRRVDRPAGDKEGHGANAFELENDPPMAISSATPQVRAKVLKLKQTQKPSAAGDRSKPHQHSDPHFLSPEDFSSGQSFREQLAQHYNQAAPTAADLELISNEEKREEILKLQKLVLDEEWHRRAVLEAEEVKGFDAIHLHKLTEWESLAMLRNPSQPVVLKPAALAIHSMILTPAFKAQYLELAKELEDGFENSQMLPWSNEWLKFKRTGIELDRVKMAVAKIREQHEVERQTLLQEQETVMIFENSRRAKKGSSEWVPFRVQYQLENGTPVSLEDLNQSAGSHAGIIGQGDGGWGSAADRSRRQGFVDVWHWLPDSEWELYTWRYAVLWPLQEPGDDTHWQDAEEERHMVRRRLLTRGRLNQSTWRALEALDEHFAAEIVAAQTTPSDF